jgi:hypothetical protein
MELKYAPGTVEEKVVNLLEGDNFTPGKFSLLIRLSQPLTSKRSEFLHIVSHYYYELLAHWLDLILWPFLEHSCHPSYLSHPGEGL